MDADLKGSLYGLNRYYRFFEHNGKQMSKKQVKAVLEYGIKQGYDSTADLSDSEIDNILRNLK